jgi:hypothetical protein
MVAVVTELMVGGERSTQDDSIKGSARTLVSKLRLRALLQATTRTHLSLTTSSPLLRTHLSLTTSSPLLRTHLSLTTSSPLLRTHLSLTTSSPLLTYTFAQTNLSPSFFACGEAADHTFRFAFLSAFSVPRSRHPRPSDACSPSQNPLRASQEVRTPAPRQAVVPFRRFHPVAEGVGRDGTPVGQACTADRWDEKACSI